MIGCFKQHCNFTFFLEDSPSSDMHLCLELDLDVHEFYLSGEGVFEVVFSECIGGYWSIIIHINENEWPNCDWILEDDGSGKY